MMTSIETKTRPERIVVIDNDPAVIPMFEVVSAGDFNLLLAPSAERGLDLLGSLTYDVDAVITDLSMSPINGYRVTEMIREQEKIRSLEPIKVFWMTAFPITDDIIDEQKRRGVIKIFRKPEDDPITIINTVRSCVECPTKYYAEDPRPKDENDA